MMTNEQAKIIQAHVDCLKDPSELARFRWEPFGNLPGNSESFLGTSVNARLMVVRCGPAISAILTLADEVLSGAAVVNLSPDIAGIVFKSAREAIRRRN